LKAWRTLAESYVDIDTAVAISAHRPPQTIQVSWLESSTGTRDEDVAKAIQEEYASVRAPAKVLIFTNTIKAAKDLGKLLREKFPDKATAVTHKDVEEAERQRIQEGFANEEIQFLVGCKTHRHGLNIEACDLVVYREPIQDPEAFLSGLHRTGKCGHFGIVIVLYDTWNDEEARLKLMLERAWTQSFNDGDDPCPLNRT
jgi:superfamily II DNA/RNA helicase